MLPALYAFVRDVDVLHARVPTPAAVFAFDFARLLRRPTFLLVVAISGRSCRRCRIAE